jgi:hypothetical protein
MVEAVRPSWGSYPLGVHMDPRPLRFAQAYPNMNSFAHRTQRHDHGSQAKG